MGSKQKQQVVDTSPWKPAQPYLLSALGAGQEAFDLANPAGQRIAGQMATQAAQGSPLINAAQGNLLGTLQGDYLGGANPYLDQIANRVGANVDARFSGAGRVGGGLHKQALAEAMAPVYANDYGLERGRQMQALGMAPMGYSLGFAPAERELQAELSRFAPAQTLASLAGGMGGMGGQQSSPLYQNRTAGALGGAMSGLGMGQALGFPLLGAAGPWALGGAILGGLL